MAQKDHRGSSTDDVVFVSTSNGIRRRPPLLSPRPYLLGSRARFHCAHSTRRCPTTPKQVRSKATTLPQIRSITLLLLLAAIPSFANIPLFVSSFQTSAIEPHADGQPTSAPTTLTQISGDLIASVPLQPENLTSRVVFPKPRHTKIEDYMNGTVVIVKFSEGTSIRLRAGNLTTVGHDDLSGIHKLLKSHKGRIIERIFDEVSSATRHDLQRKSGKTLADLNLYYRILLPGEDKSMVENLIDSLNQLPIVEIAYPLAKPAPPPTPDYTGYQGYLNAAPGGIDARYSWTVPGGTGSGVKIVDIEFSWNLNHEDLSKARNALMKKSYWTPVDPGNDNNHGTAVLGELIADANGFGVTGISYDAAIGVVPAYVNGEGYVLEQSIQFAADNLQTGDVILIELQIPGPHAGPDCSPSNQASCFYVPVEWYQAYFDAIQYATAKGVVVVEAAGNGNENLDDAIFQGAFNRSVRDSGAIIVGAGYSPGSPYGTDLYRCSFSDYGSRVDLQGWGDWRITTTGFGDLYSGGNQNSYYTSQFSGTSSASPMVAGAAANLQSVQKSRTGAPASPSWIRQRLVDTGTPQGGADHIGPRPDLMRATALGALNVALVAPANGTTIASSPVRLQAEVTGDPPIDVPDIADFYVDGVSACSIVICVGTTCHCDYTPNQTGHTYSWYATAWKSGYTSGRSPTWVFTYPPVTVTSTITSTARSTSYTTGYTTTTTTSYTSTSTLTSTIPTVTTVVLVPLTVTSTVQGTQYVTSILTTTVTSYTSTQTSTSTIPTTVALVPLTMTSTVQSTQLLTSILTTTVTSYTGTQASTSTIVVPTTIVLVPSTVTSTVQSTQYLTSILTTTVTSYTSTSTLTSTIPTVTTVALVPLTVTSTIQSTEFVTSVLTTTETSYTATQTSTSTSVVYTTVTASPGGAGAGGESSPLAYLGFISLLAVTVGHSITAGKGGRILRVRSLMERRSRTEQDEKGCCDCCLASYA